MLLISAIQQYFHSMGGILDNEFLPTNATVTFSNFPKMPKLINQLPTWFILYNNTPSPVRKIQLSINSIDAKTLNFFLLWRFIVHETIEYNEVSITPVKMNQSIA